MSFPCLCRWRIQSFLNDARREAYDEVGLLVETFVYAANLFVTCLLNILMDFFNREKVLEMFRHAYDSYMVSFRTQAPFVKLIYTVIRLLRKRPRFSVPYCLGVSKHFCLLWVCYVCHWDVTVNQETCC